jgi:hypothetical protein
MAQATTTTRSNVDPYARMTFATKVKELSDGYGRNVREEVRTLEPDQNRAALVGSKNDFGQHLPALDIDGNVALTTGRILWVDAPFASRSALRRLRKVLVRTGISPKVAPSRQHPQQVYAPDRDRTVDTHSITRRMREERAGRTSYSELLYDTFHSPVAFPPVQGPLMSNPYRIPLQVPALLIDSTNNHHLYLEHALSWKSYKALLKAMQKAGIIEQGFCKLSIKRGESFLRLPWVSKK